MRQQLGIGPISLFLAKYTDTGCISIFCQEQCDWSIYIEKWVKLRNNLSMKHTSKGSYKPDSFLIFSFLAFFSRYTTSSDSSTDTEYDYQVSLQNLSRTPYNTSKYQGRRLPTIQTEERRTSITQQPPVMKKIVKEKISTPVKTDEVRLAPQPWLLGRLR